MSGKPLIQSDLYCELHQPKVINVPIPCWAMSFVDESLPEGSRWVGACYVPAWDHEQAKLVASAMGCIPDKYSEWAMGFVRGSLPDGLPIGKLIEDKAVAVHWANEIDRLHAVANS